MVEGDLRRNVALNIKRLTDIGVIGRRHRIGCLCVVKEQKPTQEQEKARNVQWPTRRNNRRLVVKWQLKLFVEQEKEKEEY